MNNKFEYFGNSESWKKKMIFNRKSKYLTTTISKVNFYSFAGFNNFYECVYSLEVYYVVKFEESIAFSFVPMICIYLRYIYNMLLAILEILREIVHAIKKLYITFG